MRQRPHLAAAAVTATTLALACAMSAWAQAQARDESNSRQIIMAFFDRPEKYSQVRVRETQSGREVEICGDDCDLFRLKLDASAKDHHLWDAIVLFKVFVDPALADEAFVTRHTEYSETLLGEYAVGKCSGLKAKRERALCALGLLSHNLRLKYSYARYDEGYRCQSEWIDLDHVDQLASVKTRCTRAVR